MMQFIETLYADPLLKLLVDTAMKSFVIFIIAGLLVFCFRRKSAAVRGFVWGMAVVGCLIIPLFSFILPKWEVNVLPETPIRPGSYRLVNNAQPSIVPISIALSQSSSETVAPLQVSPIQSEPNPLPSRGDILTTIHWADWMAMAWAGVGLLILVRLIVGIGAIWYISLQSADFNRAIEQGQLGWNRQISIRLSDRIVVPMVWGFLRPVILLPVDAAHWHTERLRAVLLHELAHIKRWDWLMQIITQITCAVYWFNPLIWFAARRMRIETEQACDDQVLNAGYRSTDYAQHLLDITRNVRIAKATSHAAVAIARSSKIEGRLRTVLAENLNRHPVTKVAVATGLFVLICFAVPVGAMRLTRVVNSEELLPKHDVYGQDSSLKQNQKNVEICKQRLVEIGKALQAYQKEHDDFPEWLSELHPEYLPDANLLLCPADKVGGKALFPPNVDPTMPVSYGYGLHPGYRESTPKNRAMYGDVIPLVRCRHHTNQPFECLNLSFAFKIYPSSQVWEYTPEDMYGTPQKAIEALEEGLQQHADNERFFHVYRYVYRALARLYIEVGREKDIDNLVNRFKSTMKPDDLQAHFELGTMLEMANRDGEVVEVFEEFEERYPDNHRVLDELARVHAKLGNAELAEEYRKKMDPMSELVGKVVPNFSATDLEGNPISLQDYRGKVVLLDFWAVWSGRSIGEMPNVKRVYNSYKDKGFDIIGVSLDNDETRLRNYLKASDIPWRQIFSGQKWNSPLAKQYYIRAVPAPWLIDKNGTLISRKAKGYQLEQLVAEALKDKTENE